MSDLDRINEADPVDEKDLEDLSEKSGDQGSDLEPING